jgi:hypothetical protein
MSSRDNFEEDDEATFREVDAWRHIAPKIRAALLIPYSEGVVRRGTDRVEVEGTLTVGRRHLADLGIDDPSLSGMHFELQVIDGEASIRDLGSTNGTFVNGLPIHGRQRLSDCAVIRAGRTVFVFHADGGELLEPVVDDYFGMVGPFHAAPFIRRLRRQALSYGHVLLAGPSGSGKELAAHAYAALADRQILIHNAAKYGSEDEATATLFGVSERVFTGVKARVGLIELADGKVLFIDESQNFAFAPSKKPASGD